MAVEATVRGGRQLLKNLAAIRKAVDFKTAKREVRRALKPAEQEVKRLAPQSHGRANKLRRAQGRAHLKTTVQAQEVKPGGAGAIGKVTARAKSGSRNRSFHAHFFEFGTASRQTSSGANRGRIEATHFMSRGLERSKSAVFRNIANLYRELLVKPL